VGITPCFDPTTGASGGASGGGGGASLYNLAFTGPINLTDGSWTLLDPDSLIQSISYSAGVHTVVWNALAAGSSDYNWGSGSNHRAPRWYKAAEIDGNQLTSDDITQAVFYAKTDNVNRGDFDNMMISGVCVDPTSTVATTIAGMGLIAIAGSGGGDTIMGIWTVNASASTSTPGSARCMTTTQYGGRHTGSGAFTLVDAAGNRTQNGARNGNLILPSTANLHWIVGIGTRFNFTTIGAGDESQRFTLYRTALKTDLAGVL
jgi:hypothetical protein